MDESAFDGTESESCLRTKIWDMYADDWSVRSTTTAELGPNQHQKYSINLYTGRDYYFMVCADKRIQTVGLQLYGPDGTKIESIYDQGRQPTARFAPTQTGQHFLVIQARETRSATGGNTSWTVMYR